ncbi:hypothetical protein AB0M95_40065 [Sphaerisporangium sp. NPDC051017]|uniref:hypothetical protein n=1 Tax=Sphaerisporangium sp. NPDC051017 TaxID=3154636 RepID=UPI003437C4E1
MARSLKRQMDDLSAQLRAQGLAWTDVAERFRATWPLNPRQAFREAHRYTQAKVVELWNVLWPEAPLTVRRLGSWEAWPRGGHEPPIVALNRLARVYECRAIDLVDGEDHRPAEERRLSSLPPSAAVGGLTSDDLHNVLVTLPVRSGIGGGHAFGSMRDQEYDALVQTLADWARRVKRREVLALISAAAAAAGVSPLSAIVNEDELDRIARVAEAAVRVDAATVGHVEMVLHHCMRQEDRLGPKAVLETVYAQHQLLSSLLAGDVPRGLRKRMLSLLANLRRFIAWTLFNLNDYTGADYYYDRARAAAHEADDDTLNSFVLANWSHLATWRGDPRQGVEHALGALAWGQRSGSKLLTSYSSDVGARAYAAVQRRSGKANRHSDYALCMTSLDRAMRDLAAASSGDSGSELLYFYGDGQYLSTRSRCLLDTGNVQQALELATVSLAGIDPAFVRNVAFTRLDLARAHLDLRDIDLACQEIGEAAHLTSQNTSPRLARRVVDLREALSPWQRTKSVRELDDRLQVLRLPA